MNRFWNRWWKKTIWIVGVLLVVIVVAVLWLTQRPEPSVYQYGMSFNTPYARELGLDWREVYDAFLDDLGVRQLRLAAHWPMVEPQDDVYNFEELDYQLDRAAEVDAEVIMAIGRRLPRWPECHVPEWAEELTWEEQQQEITEYLEVLVKRYHDRAVIKYWQVENEPYLEVFAKQHCGEFDEQFFQEEVALVRSLDDSRPIVVTDSGNLGLWNGAYEQADRFGTSVYVHFWNPEIGQFRTVLPPAWYRLKAGVMEALHGKQPVFISELSAEPWLLEPITEVPIETQFTRMNPDKFTDILEYARHTRLNPQYLWGGEWWYWLRERGHPEMWELGKELFSPAD